MIGQSSKEEGVPVQKKYRAELRTLEKESRMPKEHVLLVFEFCEYECRTAQAVLKSLAPLKHYRNILKSWLDEPEHAETYIAKIRERLPGLVQPESPQKEQAPKVEDRLSCLPRLELFHIAQFLYPFEVFCLSMAKKNLAFLWQLESLFGSYLAKLQAQQRHDHRKFQTVTNFVLGNPFLYSALIREQAVLDVRKLIWGKHCHEPITIDWDGCLRQQYIGLPRVNYRGFYVLKEKYVRIGERSMEAQARQVVVVHYYRYLRFFPDGLVLSKVSNRKLDAEKLRAQLVEDDKSVLAGEYTLNGDQVFAKVIRGCDLFALDLRVSKVMGAQLELLTFKLNIIDENNIQQVLFAAGKNVTAKYYKWVNFQLEVRKGEQPAYHVAI